MLTPNNPMRHLHPPLHLTVKGELSIIGRELEDVIAEHGLANPLLLLPAPLAPSSTNQQWDAG